MPYGGRSTSTPILIVPRLRISSIVCAAADRSSETPASSTTAANTRVSHLILGFLSTFGRGRQACLKPAAGHGQRPAQGEIDHRDDAENQERAEGGVIEHLPCARDLDKADDRRQRGALDQVHQEPNGR